MNIFSHSAVLYRSKKPATVRIDIPKVISKGRHDFVRVSADDTERFSDLTPRLRRGCVQDKERAGFSL